MTTTKHKPINANTLKKEVQTFKAHKKEFLSKSKGKYVLIKNSEIIGFFDNAENAYREGLKKFGNVPFLIRQIAEKEPVVYIPALTLGILHAHPQ